MFRKKYDIGNRMDTADKRKDSKGSVRGAFLAGLLIFAVFANAGAVYAHRILLQQGIAEEVLRFHVLANSDSEADQNVKYLVRDAVLTWVAEQTERTEQTEDKQKMETFLLTHLRDMEAVADQVLQEQGMPYRAAVQMERCFFPDRTYGDCTFPSGWYEALRICLGEARGHNWWCVLYPKLCFSDCLHAVVEEEQMEQLEEVLTVEEYESLLRSPEEWKIAFRWF